MGLLARAAKAIAQPFWSFGPAKEEPNTKPNGSDGVQAYGGFLPTDEQRPELTGTQKWVTYGNATNTAVVATGLRRSLDMLAGTNWHAEPNEAGGKDAERGVEIVTKGLLKAHMTKPWSAVVRKAALYRYYGFSLHEWSAARSESAKQIVFTDISHRPQYTIDRWNKPDEQMPWDAVGQLTRAGNRYTIPRGRLFHCVDDSLTDSPDGVGLFRHIVELVRRLGILEGLEGLAYETDLRGMPVGRAPLAELKAAAVADGSATPEQIQSFVLRRTQVLRSALQGIVKSPEKLQHLLLDSAPFLGADQNTFSQLQKWGFELTKGESNGVDHVANAIGRIQLEIARVLGIEFVMMGGGESGGSRAMHGDKTQFFATNLQTILTEVAAFATNDLARSLVALNGLDPDTACPTLVAEPISTEAVETTCQSLASLAQAGLQHDDEAINVIRDRMHLPPAPEPDPEMMGMLGAGLALPPRPGQQQPTTGKPGRTTGQEVPVADLGPKPASKRVVLPGARIR